MNRLLASLLVVVLCSAGARAQVATSYVFSQTVGTYVPITGGTQLATATGTIGNAAIDDIAFPVTLPFPFVIDNFYTMTSVCPTSNGLLAFGSGFSATSYSPLSNSSLTPGIVAAFANDLEAGYSLLADRSLGLNQLTNVSSVGPVQVGDFLAGPGIAAGATVAAIAGNVITMSANATSTGAAGQVRAYGPWSEVRHETLGSAPDRVLVVQWKGFKRFGASSISQHMKLDFQIRLYETTNVIEVVYGDCSPGVTTTTTVAQVGLRGPSNLFPSNLNNRMNVKGISDWATSTPGTANNVGQVFNDVAPANVIPIGLTYTWTPVLFARHVPYGASCGGLALTATPTPVTGTTVFYTTSNIPLTAAISAHIVSLVLVPGLPIGGAPGCPLHVDLGLASTTLLIGAPTAVFPLAIPNDAGLIGLSLFNQSASLVPGVNPLGLLVSNGIWSTLSNQ